MNKGVLLGIAGLILLSIVAVGYASPVKAGFGRHPCAGPAVKEALEAEDYGSFISLLNESGKGKCLGGMTEEKYEQLLDRYETWEKINEALEAGDYAAWKEAINGTARGDKLLGIINEENFGKYVQMHEAMQTAHSLAKELGLPKKMVAGHANGHVPRATSGLKQ